MYLKSLLWLVTRGTLLYLQRGCSYLVADCVYMALMVLVADMILELKVNVKCT